MGRAGGDGRGRLRGVKGGSNEKREARRIGGRVREERRLIDSGGLVRLCLQHRFFRCSTRARARALACSLYVCIHTAYKHGCCVDERVSEVTQTE